VTARPQRSAKAAPAPARRFVNSRVPIKAPFKGGPVGERALLEPRATLIRLDTAARRVPLSASGRRSAS
jgi:hypothetical protein